jgi:hypothetical protein
LPHLETAVRPLEALSPQQELEGVTSDPTLGPVLSLPEALRDRMQSPLEDVLAASNSKNGENFSDKPYGAKTFFPR